MNAYDIITPGMLFIVKDKTREAAIVQLHLHWPQLAILEIKESY